MLRLGACKRAGCIEAVVFFLDCVEQKGRVPLSILSNCLEVVSNKGHVTEEIGEKLVSLWS